ncbi:MAG: hypothetical protein HKM02_10930 [Pseudomonadales bacterium]|nr:hypothetical protein [Pseudomonadales bacterium]
MKTAILVGVFISATVAPWAWAQNPTSPTGATIKSTPDNNSSAQTADSVTNVVGSREAPNTSNVLPWRVLSESKLNKEDITSSVLQESLEPLDPETLKREIEFHKALDATPKN